MRARWVSAGLCAVAMSLPLAGQTGAPASVPAQSPGGVDAKSVRVRGVDLFYVEQGRGEPVVLLHGFLHDYRVWRSEVAALSKTHRAIALSRRYRWPGKPPAEAFDLSPEADFADLVAFIDTLQLERVHLVGHSGGANLALRLARERPALVRSLVVAEPGLPALIGKRPDVALPFTPELLDEVRRAYEAGQRERVLELIGNAVVGPGAERRLRPEAGQIALDNLWQVEQWWRGGAPEPPFTCEDGRRLTVPVLLIGGERSPMLFKVSLDELQKCLANAERVVLPDTSHGLQLENPGEFDRALLAFLNRRQ